MSKTTPSGATVTELIRLREQLSGWIAKLDDVGPQASSRVAERVRADYDDRLRRVNEELSAHTGEIEADLAGFREALGDAELRRDTAAEALEEARLRHLIGELDDAAWNEARPELERDVEGAEGAVAHAASEVERLQALWADIRGAEDARGADGEIEVVWTPEEEAAPAEARAAREPEPAPPAATQAEDEITPPPPAAETAESEPLPPVDPRQAADAASADAWDPFGAEFGTDDKAGDAGDDLPWLSGVEDAKPWAPPEEESGLEFLRGIDEPAPAPQADAAPAPADDLGADDLAFLEELDRSIGGSAPRPAAGRREEPPAPAAESPAPAAAGRTDPLLCKECGAINEPHSWYCEICGSEL
jgi:hypothetical protein